jgi:integration host factor subunit alpha
MTLTKDHIATSISNHFDLPKTRSVELIESLLEIMKQTLEDGEDVLITGFGKFCVKEKSERRGRNPATGNDLMLGARRVVIFRCSSVLRDKLNGDRKG